VSTTAGSGVVGVEVSSVVSASEGDASGFAEVGVTGVVVSVEAAGVDEERLSEGSSLGPVDAPMTVSVDVELTKGGALRISFGPSATCAPWPGQYVPRCGMVACSR
jgi:hypothetical protein